MSSFKMLCEKYFGSSDFYDILKVNLNASEKEVKKAYYKLSLLLHPDRVEEDEKEIATEKFKVLGKIHSILQDKNKRKLYDDFGEYDEDDDSSLFNWMEYWRSMFKKIDIKDIQNHEKEYIGSETELRDIKKAYINGKGNMDTILEMVPFSNCDSEARIIGIVQKMVDDGEVEKYDKFFNENKRRRMRRHKKWQKEKKEAESVDMEKLEKEIEKNMNQRAQQFGKILSDIEEKYAPKKKRHSITEGNTTKRQKKI